MVVWGGHRHLFPAEWDLRCSEFCLSLQEAARRKGERGMESLRLLFDGAIDELAWLRPRLSGPRGSQEAHGGGRVDSELLLLPPRHSPGDVELGPALEVISPDLLKLKVGKLRPLRGEMVC